MLAVSAELEPLAGAFKVPCPTVGDTVGLGGVALACEFPEPRLFDWRLSRQTPLRGGEAFDGGGRAGGRGAGEAYFFDQCRRQADAALSSDLDFETDFHNLSGRDTKIGSRQVGVEVHGRE
jgi:hypothetical protein